MTFKQWFLVLTVFTFNISLAHATIVDGLVTSGSGDFVKLIVPFDESDPDNTVGNDNFQDPNLYGFDEGQNIVLTSNIAVDDLAVGGVGTGAGSLSSGTVVASHYIFFDPENFITQEGWIDFDSEILAVISSSNNLDNSDFLIPNNVTYLESGLRGLEAGDSVTISGDRLYVDWAASTPGDYIRVLTTFSPAAAVPEPGTLILFMLGMVGLGFIRRGRQ